MKKYFAYDIIEADAIIVYLNPFLCYHMICNRLFLFCFTMEGKTMERPHFDIEASGAKMRQIRVSRHISVKEVMDYMEFESTQAIYKWEAGKCLPQADNLVALAFLYNVSPTELLVREDQESSFSLQKCA